MIEDKREAPFVEKFRYLYREMTGTVSDCTLSFQFVLSDVFKLAVIQRGVETVLRQKGIVRALLDDVAIAHDEDQIGIADGGEPVGDDKAGASAHQFVHAVLNELLGAGIDR